MSWEMLHLRGCVIYEYINFCYDDVAVLSLPSTQIFLSEDYVFVTSQLHWFTWKPQGYLDLMGVFVFSGTHMEGAMLPYRWTVLLNNGGRKCRGLSKLLGSKPPPSLYVSTHPIGHSKTHDQASSYSWEMAPLTRGTKIMDIYIW